MLNKIKAYGVHIFTASGAVVALLTLQAIVHQHYQQALMWMGIAIVIDAVDGTLARRYHVKTYSPNIDGALLDNIIDYLNYVITPCFFLLHKSDMLPTDSAIIITSLIAMASAYQFTQADAKTADHFFKGFPSYWNLAVFYCLILNMGPLFNAIALCLLVVLVFIPIKYIYPSRLDAFNPHKALKQLFMLATAGFSVSAVLLLASYPAANPWLKTYLISYPMFYAGLSIYLGQSEAHCNMSPPRA